MRPCSTAQRARTRNPPRPVSYACTSASGSSTRVPPVGKSGPGMCASRSIVDASGCAIRCSAAAHTSPALCGGIEVAMPTAMPAAPLASRFGNAEGRITGSVSTPS